MSDDFMPKLVAFCQERGFIWGPSPEIYGGLSGFYEYAPLGKLLKNRIEEQIRQVFAKNDFWEVECPTVVPKAVWEASGHLGNFTDPLVKDEKGNVYRADKLIEEYYHTKGEDAAPIIASAKGDFLKIIQEQGITVEGKKIVPELIAHNLMMRTTIGMDIEAYNRPETATTTYLPFNRYFDYFRKKLPFAVFQIGKAYRNEISPRQFTLRMREFTQAEAQIFLFKDQKDGFDAYTRIKDLEIPLWHAKDQLAKKQPAEMTLEEARKAFLKNDAYAYTLAVAYQLFTAIGIPKEKIRLRQHGDDEKAFYADDAWDIEVNLNSVGWTEMCGIHDRTDYDLTQHAKHSKKPLTASDETHKKEVPHILEIAFGTDRMVFATLDLTYNPQEESQGKTTLHLPLQLAPIQVQICPLVKKDGMSEKAREIFDSLVGTLTASYDESGSIGKRYLRAAMQGTPYCITIDGQTLEDSTVTIRDRDSEGQKRIAITAIEQTIKNLLDSKIQFSSLP